MSLPLNQVDNKEGNFTSEKNIFKGGERCVDLLEEEIIHRSKSAEKVVIT